jgi:hypothetical protein
MLPGLPWSLPDNVIHIIVQDGSTGRYNMPIHTPVAKR